MVTHRGTDTEHPVNTVLKILAAVIIAVLICVGARRVMFLDTLTRTTAEIRNVLDGALAREGPLTRAAASNQIADRLQIVNTQITGLRADVKSMEKDLRERSERQIADGLKKLDGQLTTLDGTISTQADKITTPAAALFPPAQNILANASETSDLLLNCDHNQDCLANRVIPAMKNVEHMAKAGERMANAVADVTPNTAQAVKSTSKDLSIIVNRFAKPVSWLKGVAGTALTWAGKFLCF